jgi:iron complex outermembrane receptor protein
VGAQWVDSQRYGNDFTNACAARVPSYTTFDARYAVKLGAWELAATGLNLADRHYFSNAFGCQSGIYPSDGRQLKLSARYDF